MSPITKISTAFVGLMLAFAPCAHSQDKRIKKSDLPPAVQRTAAQQSAGATVRGYAQETENGKLEYEIEMTVNGHSKDVNIDHDGNVLEIEEGVTLGDLPAAVRASLQKQAAAGKITKVESVSEQDKLVAYEAHILTGAKKSEVQVGPDGKPLDHEE